MKLLRECLGGPMDGEWVDWPTAAPIWAVTFGPAKSVRAAVEAAETGTPQLRFGFYGLVVSKDGTPAAWTWEGESEDLSDTWT